MSFSRQTRKERRCGFARIDENGMINRRGLAEIRGRDQRNTASIAP